MKKHLFQDAMNKRVEVHLQKGGSHYTLRAESTLSNVGDLSPKTSSSVILWETRGQRSGTHVPCPKGLESLLQRTVTEAAMSEEEIRQGVQHRAGLVAQFQKEFRL